VHGHRVSISDLRTGNEIKKALSCWQCFDSYGHMCYNLDSATHMKNTGSKNLGHGVCCKPGSTAEECKTDLKKGNICGPAVAGDAKTDKYKDVMTNGRNH